MCATHDKAYRERIGTCIRSVCTDSAGRVIEADPWIVEGSKRRPLTIHP